MKTIAKYLILLSLLIMAVLTCGCGNKEAAPPPVPEPAQSSEPSPTPSPEPTPTPTPYIEPTAEPSADTLIFNAQQLPSGLMIINGEEYIKLSEAVNALGSELVQDDGMSFSFDWRLGHASLRAESQAVNYLDEDRNMDFPALLCSEQTDLYVPVYSFCKAAEIGTYYDQEFSTLYCTPASGDWEIPGGYDIPILRYHMIDWPSSPDANMVIHPDNFEQQLKYLTENGYTTIWFEDLWNIKNIEKPVLITFDDGYVDNYKYMFPILEKYNCKATIFVITSTLLPEPHMHMSSDMVRELSQSGLVSIQSHCVNHEPTLAYLSPESQQYEMEESKKAVTRLTGKEAFVLSYPCGEANADTLNMVPDYYKFGLMTYYPENYTYHTGDNQYEIHRYYVEQHTDLNTIAGWLEYKNENN